MLCAVKGWSSDELVTATMLPGISPVPHSIKRLKHPANDKAMLCVSRPKSMIKCGMRLRCTLVNGSTTHTKIRPTAQTAALYNGITLRNNKSNNCNGFMMTTSTSSPTPLLYVFTYTANIDDELSANVTITPIKSITTILKNRFATIDFTSAITSCRGRVVRLKN